MVQRIRAVRRASARLGRRASARGKQCFRCRECGRQFVLNPKKQPYPPEIKQLCLKMYLNGMGRKQSFPAA